MPDQDDVPVTEPQGDQVAESHEHPAADGPTASWLGEYEGLGLEAAKARAEAEGRRCRVLGPDAIVTLDFRIDRLNLMVDADGNLVRMNAG